MTRNNTHPKEQKFQNKFSLVELSAGLKVIDTRRDTGLYGIRNKFLVNYGKVMTRYRPVWLLGADTDISAIHRPIADTDNWYFQNLVFWFIIKNIMYSMPYLFFKNFKTQDLWAKIFEIAAILVFCYDFNKLINDAFVSATMADVCSMVHLVCFFMKALLQDNCLDLVCCAFLRKLSACMRNITAFCQHLLRPIQSSTYISVKHKYGPVYL